jgi:hypothetical protein
MLVLRHRLDPESEHSFHEQCRFLVPSVILRLLRTCLVRGSCQVLLVLLGAVLHFLDQQLQCCRICRRTLQAHDLHHLLRLRAGNDRQTVGSWALDFCGQLLVFGADRDALLLDAQYGLLCSLKLRESTLELQSVHTEELLI